MVIRGRYQVIAQENPLSYNKNSNSNTDTKISILCDGFKYILWVRNPIEKALCHFREMGAFLLGCLESGWLRRRRLEQ